MLRESTKVFLWTDPQLEKTLVAASASSNSIEVYFALENKCSRHGSSCTFSSQTWFEQVLGYETKEILILD